jgi:hypothetical protein
MAVAAGPALHEVIETFPAAQVEVADAEVCVVGHLQCLLQCREEFLLDVVEDAGHGRAFRPVWPRWSSNMSAAIDRRETNRGGPTVVSES